MMTQQLRAGILSAPLAAIDRRALSQAWYSALGFARERPSAAAARRAPSRLRPPAGETPDRAPGAAGTRVIRSVLRVCPPPVAGKRDAAPPAAPGERRAASSALARAIERRFARTPLRPSRATFGLDGGRVHVILRSRGSDVRLIALCAPSARATVARALEQARYALAARGIALGVERIAASGSR